MEEAENCKMQLDSTNTKAKQESIELGKNNQDKNQDKDNQDSGDGFSD